MDYVDCLKLAISLGGDVDTLAAIADTMAYEHYKMIPEELIENAKAKLLKWIKPGECILADDRAENIEVAAPWAWWV